MLPALRLFSCLLIFICWYQQAMASAPDSQPWVFMENRGQVIDQLGRPHPEVLMTARHGAMTVYVTATSIHYLVQKKAATNASEASALCATNPFSKPTSGETRHISLELVGANAAARLLKGPAAAYHETYYLPHCPQGITARGYTQFTIANVYEGIDWVFKGDESGFSQQFVLREPRLASRIRWRINGAEPALTPTGAINLGGQLGEITATASQGSQHLSLPIMSCGNSTFGFQVKEAQSGQALAIAPAIIWSTYYGGDNADVPIDLAADAQGNLAMAGYSSSSNFPVQGAFQPTNKGGTYDATLVKFSPTFTRLWATYYGGSADDRGLACTFDGDGNLILAGTSASNNLPMLATSLQGNRAGSNDGFLAKFSPGGARIWSRFVGAANWEEITSLKTGHLTGHIYACGFTESTGLGTAGTAQPGLAGNFDAFAARYDTAGAQVWFSYLGGGSNELEASLAVDSSENIYVGGATSSPDFPVTTGAFQTAQAGSDDGFLAKLDSAGRLQWASYQGGISADQIHSLAANKSGVYLTGITNSSDFPVLNPLQPAFGGGQDGFVAHFSAAGQLRWATFWGGSDFDNATGIGLDSTGMVHVTGNYNSPTFAATGGGNATSAGNYDGYLAQFSPTGTAVYAGLFGGGGIDSPVALVIHGNRAAITGTTVSRNFPNSGGFQPNWGGLSDGFLLSYGNIIPTRNQQLAGTRVQVYPNPAKGKVELRGLAELARLCLYNSQGQLVLEELSGGAEAQLDLGALAQGIYLLHIASDAGITVHRLVIE